VSDTLRESDTWAGTLPGSLPGARQHTWRAQRWAWASVADGQRRLHVAASCRVQVVGAGGPGAARADAIGGVLAVKQVIDRQRARHVLGEGVADLDVEPYVIVVP